METAPHASFSDHLTLDSPIGDSPPPENRGAGPVLGNVFKPVMEAKQINMMLKKLATAALIGYLFAFMVACSNTPLAPVTTTPVNELSLIAEAGPLSVWAIEMNPQTAQDILAALQTNSKQVCSDLQTGCRFSVAIEVYPDQASFDEHVMNTDMRGYFAISGNGDTIQMVSPSNPTPHRISYEDGVLVTVHEYVHLVLDEVNLDLPTWLDEGAAVYISPHAPYTVGCKGAFPFELIPTFEQLRDAYQEIQAPDLFAYTAVDFIVHEYGLEQLNLLLRDQDDMQSVLGVSETEFERAWHGFIRTEYWGGTAQ